MCTLSEGMVSSSFSSFFSPFFFRAPQKTSAGDNWVMSILQIQDLTTVQLTTRSFQAMETLVPAQTLLWPSE